MKIAVIAAFVVLASWLLWTGSTGSQIVVTSIAPAPKTIQSQQARGPRLPAPRLRTAPQEAAPTEENKVAQLVEWLEKGGTNRLTTPQLAGYLAANGRNAESLLAAFRTSGDKELLKEALEKFPNDPQVNFTALFHSATPEERQARIEALKQSAPDNAMANYLAAQEAFKAGNTDLAVQELMAASGKGAWQDYSREFIQSAEEAYRAAGHSDAEAKALAATGLLLPHLQELRDLGRKVNDLAGLYQQAGDLDSALAARQIGLNLGQRFEEGTVDNSLLKQLVGIAIQNQMLASMNPASAYDNSGRTVADEVEALKQRRKTILELGQQGGSIFPTLSEQELGIYFDRQKTFGEMATLRWLIGRQGKP
ncbi:MAG: hypothetical protein K0Q55_136 [Verrucomicrobia bacterium]|nr:hypothetical protein [Verrucomicrobiota bacterium]